MKKNTFIGIFLATIFLIRFILYLIPRTNSIYTDSFHHIYIGIILLIIYFIIKNQVLLAVTLGLIIDQITQLPFYLLKLINIQVEYSGYWSFYSIISTIIAILITLLIIKKYKK